MATDQNVKEPVQVEETVQPQEQTNVSQNPQETSDQVKEENSSKEYNFRRLEESKKQLEGKVEELEGFIRKIVTENTESKKEAPPEDYLGLADEDLAEGKHLKIVSRKVEELTKQLKQQQMQAIPDRLTAKFSDFNDVVSKENIEKLKNTEPELYASITAGSDLYAAGVSAYKTLKSMGIVSDAYQSQKEKVQDNHNRPLSAQSIKGQGPLSTNIFEGGLTTDLKKQLQREMADAAKAR